MDTLINTDALTDEIDWKRVRIFLIVGLIAAFAALAGDMILGWGTSYAAYSAGLEMLFNKYRNVSTGRAVLSMVIGLVGYTAEGICCYAVYRIIAAGSASQAKLFRTGMIGCTALGGAMHAMCCASVYVYTKMYSIEPETAFWECLQFAVFFLIPVLVLYLVFFGIVVCSQAWAFYKEMTPYPKWCALFTLALGIPVLALMKFLGGNPLFEALAAGWISIGHIIMFGGLLAMSKKAESGNF